MVKGHIYPIAMWDRIQVNMISGWETPNPRIGDKTYYISK